jgi:hypothetical protein
VYIAATTDPPPPKGNWYKRYPKTSPTSKGIDRAAHRTLEQLTAAPRTQAKSGLSSDTRYRALTFALSRDFSQNILIYPLAGGKGLFWLVHSTPVAFHISYCIYYILVAWHRCNYNSNYNYIISEDPTGPGKCSLTSTDKAPAKINAWSRPQMAGQREMSSWYHSRVTNDNSMMFDSRIILNAETSSTSSLYYTFTDLARV